MLEVPDADFIKPCGDVVFAMFYCRLDLCCVSILLVASKDAILMGSVNKSSDDRVVCMCVQLKRCCVVCL